MDLLLPLYVSVGLLGLIIGSFLNVVIYRIGTGAGLGGRSACGSCDTQLRWFELIPVVSFLVLRARCRTCSSPISWQYPLVELATGLAFAAAFYVTGPSLWFFVHATLLAVLIVIFVYDLYHMIIPTIPLCIAIVAAALIGFSTLGVQAAFMGAAILFAPLYLLWRISGGKWIGLGDADLVAVFGFALGSVLGVSSVVLGFWLGCAYAVVLLCRKVFKLGDHAEIPLGPFLIAGFFAVYLLGIDVVGLSHIL